MDSQQSINWPEAGPSSAPMDTASYPSVLLPAQAVAGSSSVNLNSPQFAVPSLPQPNAPIDPLNPGRGRGRGRGRGLRGVGRGHGRGRGRGSTPGVSRQSTRISTRSTADGGVSKLKLSLKMNASGAGEAYGGRMTSFLGEYDRELDDNPEEPLEFEEQFILRVPKEVADGRKGEVGLREMIKGKGLEGLEMKFVDTRRAAVKINGTTYSSKLVDLPCIIESQKTHDSRHLFKVADISQMLVVGPQIASEASLPPVAINQDDYIWPHGITPPLRNVRKRRFRKRLSRRTIEVVEEQVEELLKKDMEAESSSYDLIDVLDPEIPDSYYQDYDPNAPWQAFHPEGDEEGSYGDPGSVMPSEGQWGEEGDEMDEDDDAEGEDDSIDLELAQALMAPDESEEDEDGFDDGDADDADEVGEEGDDDEDEDDEETLEKKGRIRQFASEIKQLEAAIEKKRAGFQGGNPIMIKRFEETIAGMLNDINTKAVARQVLVDEIEKAKPGVQGEDGTPAGNEGTPVGGAAAVDSEEDDDLFGEDDEEGAGETPTKAAPDTPVSFDAAGEDESASVAGEREDTPTPRQGGDMDREAEGEDDDEEEDEEEDEDDDDNGPDEMSAMLNAAMAGGLGEGDAAAQAQDASEALDAIESMEFQDDLEQLGGDFVLPNSPAVDISSQVGVAGGVGQRRLLEGAEDDDSGSSDDSDD